MKKDQKKRLFFFLIVGCFLTVSCQKGGPVSPQLPESHSAEFITELLPSGDEIQMVLVPSGWFWMGADNTETEAQPFRNVTVNTYYIDRYEITVAQFRACVVDGSCTAPARGEDCNWDVSGREDHPINCVSWFDAQRFCSWADKRLPTEAEWEKAARGTDGRPFPWGVEPPDCERAVTGWASLGCGEQGTWPVGSKPAGESPYGAHDMIGNVWEWVADAYEVDYYKRGTDINPVNRALTDHRVLRGNSWYYSYPTLVSLASNRFRFRPARWYPYIGFRCVKSDQSLGTVDAGLSEPQVFHHTNWIERNMAARQVEGEVPFDIAPRAEEMVRIPEGEFFMGAEQGESDESPIRQVYLDAFDIDKHEVTVAQYHKCVVDGGCKELQPLQGVLHAYEANFCNWGQPNRDNHPINCIKWRDAHAYCQWAGKRLPTEAEWEKAARGIDGRRFPWGSDQANCDWAVIDDGGDGCGRESTWPVGSKPEGASPYGVMDMSGNVWEWVDDWYDHGYYGRASDKNPHNDQILPLAKQEKVLRGGSWADQTEVIHRAANRLSYNPDTPTDYTIGFRCARDVEK